MKRMNDVIMKKIMLLVVGVTARLAVVAALLLTAGYPLHVGAQTQDRKCTPEPTENDDCKGDASCIGFCEGYDYSGPCANCRISEGLVCYMYSPTTYVTKTTYRGNCEIAYGTNLCHCDFDVKTSPNLGTITIACRCNP